MKIDDTMLVEIKFVRGSYNNFKSGLCDSFQLHCKRAKEYVCCFGAELMDKVNL